MKEVIDAVSGLGTLVLSVLALLFSTYAYRKTSFKHEFKRKQLDAMFKLIEELQDTIFSIQRYDKLSSQSSGTLVRFFQAREHPEYYKEFIETEHSWCLNENCTSI